MKKEIIVNYLRIHILSNLFIGLFVAYMTSSYKLLGNENEVEFIISISMFTVSAFMLLYNRVKKIIPNFKTHVLVGLISDILSTIVLIVGIIFGMDSFVIMSLITKPLRMLFSTIFFNSFYVYITKEFRSPHKIMDFVRDKETNIKTVFGMFGYGLAMSVSFLNIDKYIGLSMLLIMYVLIDYFTFKIYRLL